MLKMNAMYVFVVSVTSSLSPIVAKKTAGLKRDALARRQLADFRQGK